MASSTPLYKYTQLPKTLTTDFNSSYYGAQAQRSRREAQLAQASQDYSAGNSSFSDFSATANRILNGSVGLSERTSISKTQSDAQTAEYNSLDAQQATAYAQGQLSYDQYKTYLEQTLSRYNPSSAQYAQRSQDVTQLGIDKSLKEIDALTSEFNTGGLSYSDYVSQLNSYLGQFDPGSDQYTAIYNAATQANELAATRSYTSLYDQYANGQISYQDYLSGVSQLGNQLSTDINGNSTGANANDYLITDANGNQISVGQAISNITANYNSQQEAQYADDYDKGKISFETYANFLKQELGLYQTGTAQYEGLGSVWEDAYKTELDRYKATQDSLYQAGQLKDKEYKQFNKWYKKQVDKGPVQTTTFKEFTPKNKSSKKK